MAKTKRLTNKDDNFTGGPGPDHVLGLGGNDKIDGKGGNDVLIGGAGNDTLTGGTGNDKLNGGTGNDKLLGGDGNDTLIAKSGDDRAIGGAGDDTVVLNGNFADAVITKINGGYEITLGNNTTTVKGVEHFKFSDGVRDDLNRAPDAAASQDLSGNEDTAVTGSVGATDKDGDALTYTIPSTGDGSPAHGTVTIDASGNFTYTPTADYNGTDTFTVTISDGKGGTTTQVVNIDLAAVNDAPVADASQDVSGTEDTAVTGSVVATDVDGDTLTYAVPSTGDGSPAHGTVTIDASGNFTYTPAADYNGTDTFTVTISDGHGGTTTQVVNIDLAAVNDAPVAAATQDVSGNEDTAITGSVGATDVDGDTLTYTVPSTGDGAPAHGTVTIDASGNYTYTPAANYNGSDTFTVTVSDGHGGTTTQVVNVAVAAVNDAPVADASQDVSGTEDTAVTGSVVASDVDGDSLTYTVPSTGDGSPAHGTVTIDASGNFTYTPTADYNGTDSFTVTISDGHGGTTTQVVNVTLGAVNDAPVAAATQDVSGNEDTAITGSVGATDVDGDTLTYTVPSTGDGSPAHGTVTIDASGNFTYTPAENYNGTDTFTVTVSDGHGGTTTQVVNIDLAAVNDAPVATGVADSQIVDNSGSLFPSFAVSDVEGNFGAGTVLKVQSDDSDDKFGFNTAGGVTTAANVVLVNGVGVGTFTTVNGVLTITFNANATEALIETVGQAVTVDVHNDHAAGGFGSGSSNLTVTLTDSDGAVSDPVTAEVVSIATSNAVTVDDLDHDSQVTGIADTAIAVDKNQNATVTYVQSVGVGNVDDVKLTITLGGESDPSDVLAIPTALAGDGTIANIAGHLIYQTGGIQYNVGTVTQVGNTITVQLSDDVGNADNLSAATFDSVLALVIRSTTVDAGVNDGVRDITFTVDGVGSVVTTTATAHLVVTDGGEILLTADSDPITAGNQGDTNATLAGIDPTGINVFNAAAGTLQSNDNFSGGSTGNDILTAVLDSGLGAVSPTIAAVETFNLSSNGAGATLNAANITNTNAMTINISGANEVSVTHIGSTFTTVDASDATGAVNLTTQNGQSLDVTTGSGATSITASDSGSSQAAISVNTTEALATLTLSGSADFSIEGSTNVSVNASGTTDSLSIESVDSSISLTTGTGAVTITNVAAAATLTVDADLMADDAVLKVSGEGDINVNGGDFLGNLDASGLSGDLRVDLGDDEVGAETASVTLGSGANQTILGAGGDDTITVNAAAAVKYDDDGLPGTADVNVNLMIGGAGTYVLNSVTADVDASTATGAATVNVLASADINIATGALTTIMGAAAAISIDASGAATSSVTIGSLADDFAGDVDVTGLGNGAVLHAEHLTGALAVATTSGGSNTATVDLGAGVSSFSLTAGAVTSADAAGYTGTIALLASPWNVEIDHVGSITIDADGTLPASSDDFSGTLDVTLAANVNTTIITGTGNGIGFDADVLVASGDVDANSDGVVDARSTITVNASELGSGANVVVNDGANGFNLNVSVTGLGDGTRVDLFGSGETASTATVTLATTTLGAGDAIDMKLGTSQTVDISSSSATASAGTVFVDASAAVAGDFAHDLAVTPDSNVQITLTGNSAYDLTNVSADVHASAATGAVAIDASGAGNALSLTTGSGADDITGGAGTDTIVAGAGSDTLDGGAGRDILTGGSGADTFVFNNNETGNTIATADHVTDFVINEDVIDLSSYNLTSGFSDLTISVGASSTVITIGDGHDDKVVLDGNYTGQTFTADQFVF